VFRKLALRDVRDRSTVLERMDPVRVGTVSTYVPEPRDDSRLFQGGKGNVFVVQENIERVGPG